MVQVIDTPMHEIQCKNVRCGARLKYEFSDVVRRKHTDYGGGVDVFDAIVCPVCKKDVEIRSYY